MRKIFYNGDFLTLENENTNISAVVINDKYIEKVGLKEEIFQFADDETELIDLKGKTMMPAFIDPHSHFTAVANNLLKVDLSECINFEEIKKKLISFKKENNIADEEWIIACNYDHNNLDEKDHPKKDFLDKILPNNPVILQHRSGHVGIFNSKGLQRINIDEKTPQIEGGIIEKINGKLTGYLEENAFIQSQLKVPMASFENLINAYKKAQNIYLENGITTVQEGMTYKEMIPLYKQLIANNLLNLDLVSYIPIDEEEIFKQNFGENFKKYKNNLKIGGYKIFLDGSPQGRTAWMRTPYNGEDEYCGYGTMKDEEVEKAVRKAYEEDFQILAHCNGDRAAQQYIDAIRKTKNNNKIRPVMIHSQLLGTDQIPDLKILEIIPSFFIAHIYHWGDVHIRNFGYERAKKISPTGTALKENIIYTFHQDSPVISPNMFETIWCAVKRETKEKVLLDQNERIGVIDAIKAVTINAAYQYFEEEKKGSIKEGKYANLIITDKNPLKVDIDEIKNIKVMETLKEGKTLYTR